MSEKVLNSFDEHLNVLLKSRTELAESIMIASEMIKLVINSGKKVLLCGNGGSASDAQHIAAEFTGRFIKDRKPLAAIALTTDSSALTAIGNDYGFDRIFERQVQALASQGDVLIAITTSGNSRNVICAIDKAKEMGCHTIVLSGNDGGMASTLADVCITVPSTSTARIQEIHILIGHIFCSFLENVT